MVGQMVDLWVDQTAGWKVERKADLKADRKDALWVGKSVEQMDKARNNCSKVDRRVE
jgi:hypothetical protein